MYGWVTLKLNPDKTEFILMDEGRIRDSLKSLLLVSLLNNFMEPAESLKNFSVTLNADNSIPVLHIRNHGL